MDRGIALHKLSRLIPLATCGGGYLNFMGNEFGHPEWIDFPRSGNGWSYKYARRQWSLVDNPDLRYHDLGAFDAAMIGFVRANGLLGFPPEHVVSDEKNKILVFKRKNCIFAFNFNPSGSFADYKVPAPAGKYSVALDTDSPGFGGFGRVDHSVHHFTVSEEPTDGQKRFDDVLSLYLPSRTAIVLILVD